MAIEDVLRKGLGMLLIEEPLDDRKLAACRTRSVLPPGEFFASGDVAIQELLQRAQETPGPWPLPFTAGRGSDLSLSGFQIWSFERAMEPEEILQFWDRKGQEAANRGTEAHYQIELWLNCEGCRLNEPEVALGLEFIGSDLSGLGAKVYRTEWRIFGEAEDIAGSIDFAGKLPSGELILVDWKRSDKLRKGTRSFADSDRMAEPFEHLADCKCAVYALQLNLYRWLLEAYYGERVALMVLVSVHPEAPFVTAVPDLKLEVSYLMQERRRRHSALLRAEAQAPEILRCAHTRQLMTDPVIVEGKRYQRNCARRILRGHGCDNLQSDNELRQASEELLKIQNSTPQGLRDAEEVQRRLADLLARRRNWKELMPPDGLPISNAYLRRC
eukprot:TRINITY_DN31209_c0_g2_i1.p1 TRINITY_DN31209_c0_g2~~TRINITY_DN31209_c0_g2_i1.p1  ORF type:complete len:401 (-),score=64.14 TRINITY_DN31209_c0_g2_i1:193-1350(-)